MAVAAAARREQSRVCSAACSVAAPTPATARVSEAFSAKWRRLLLQLCFKFSEITPGAERWGLPDVGHQTETHAGDVILVTVQLVRKKLFFETESIKQLADYHKHGKAG